MAKNKNIVKHKKVLLVKKANELIQAQYKFDIWETRAFLSVLAQIQRTDEEFKEYRIVYKNIMEDFDLKAAEAYNLLREAVLRLMSKRVHIKYEKDGVFREDIYTIFNKANTLSNEKQQNVPINYDKQGYIDIAMHPDMRDLLLQLKKNFTTYDIKHITQLGVYAVRIYELLKQYERIGKRKISIEQMKQMFELVEEYPLFANFYQKIINPSIKEINKHTDLQVDTPQKIKEGRKVVALSFTFRKKEDSFIAEPEPTTDFKNEVEAAFETITSSAKPIQATQQEKEQAAETPSPVVEPTRPLPSQVIAPEPVKAPDPTEALYTEFEADVVKGFGVTPFVLVQLLQNYDAELIRKQIRITKRKRGTGEAINIAGFFVNAVKSDYNDPEEAKEEKKREQQRQKALKKQALSEELQELIDLIIQQENNTVRKLLGNDEGLRMRAIEYATKMITNSPRLQKIIEEKEYDLETLDLMFWKQDKFLHAHFIEAIKKLEPKVFGYLKSLHERVVELDGEIKDFS
jgi:plasmid replication initiation protein